MPCPRAASVERVSAAYSLYRLSVEPVPPRDGYPLATCTRLDHLLTTVSVDVELVPAKVARKTPVDSVRFRIHSGIHSPAPAEGGRKFETITGVEWSDPSWLDN